MSDQKKPKGLIKQMFTDPDSQFMYRKLKAEELNLPKIAEYDPLKEDIEELEQELKALREIAIVLRGLPTATQQRVLDYHQSRVEARAEAADREMAEEEDE
jgi:DNA-directed RNA polymerase subunit H (RpoH/RPB5)